MKIDEKTADKYSKLFEEPQEDFGEIGKKAEKEGTFVVFFASYAKNARKSLARPKIWPYK